MQKALHTFFVFVLVVAAAAALTMTILPIPGGVELRVVQSGSMEPAITTGSVVLLRPTEAYQKRDIITYYVNGNDGTPVTHRVVANRIQGGEPYYTTQGDANDTKDSNEVSHSNVIGKVIFTVPVLGYLFDFVQQPIGFALIVGLPALLVIFDHINKIVRTMREHRNKSHSTTEEKEDIS